MRTDQSHFSPGLQRELEGVSSSEALDSALIRHGYEIGMEFATRLLRERPGMTKLSLTFMPEYAEGLVTGFVETLEAAKISVGLNCFWLAYARFPSLEGTDEIAHPVQEYRNKGFDDALRVVLMDRLDRVLEARLLMDLSRGRNFDTDVRLLTPFAWQTAIEQLRASELFRDVDSRHGAIARFPSKRRTGYLQTRDRKREWIDEELHLSRFELMPSLILKRIEAKFAPEPTSTSTPTPDGV